MKKLHIKVGESFEFSAEGMGPSVALAVIGAAVVAILIFGAVVALAGLAS